MVVVVVAEVMQLQVMQVKTVVQVVVVPKVLLVLVEQVIHPLQLHHKEMMAVKVKVLPHRLEVVVAVAQGELGLLEQHQEMAVLEKHHLFQVPQQHMLGAVGAVLIMPLLVLVGRV
jgi:hypothetical protein